MKKVLFLMLFLIILGAASVNSQVRIGGSVQPNASAVLDLNAADGINNGTKGLSLPRVALASTSAFTPLAAHAAGMIVYNTATAGNVTPGTYYNDGTKWVRIGKGDGTLTAEVDGVIGNELTDTIAGGGLTKSGLGTSTSPYKVGIKPGGVTGTMLAQGALASRITRVEITFDTMYVSSRDGSLLSWRAVDSLAKRGYIHSRCIPTPGSNADYAYSWTNTTAGNLWARFDKLRVKTLNFIYYCF